MLSMLKGLLGTVLIAVEGALGGGGIGRSRGPKSKERERASIASKRASLFAAYSLLLASLSAALAPVSRRLFALL